MGVPTYTQMPTRKQWDSDMGFAGVLGRKPFPAARAIGDLLDLFHGPAARQGNLAVIEVMGQTWMLTRYVMKKQMQVRAKPNPTAAQQKLGATGLSGGQSDAIIALARFCEERLRTALTRNGDFETGFRDFFDRRVHDAEAAEDEQHVNVIQWLTTVELKRVKLRFRHAGVATRMNEAGLLVPYDTAECKEGCEVGGANLFVMDERGHIYAYGNKSDVFDGMNLKHSSFLWGEPTRAAGTMRVEQGQIVFVTPRSGHYKPTIRQMLTFLERLQAYGVELSRVIFYRTNESPAWMAQHHRPAILEPCNALELVRQRAFPGAYPQSMFIARDGRGY